MFNIVGKLVSVATGELLGYKIQGSTDYTAVVSEAKAKEIGVDDINIVQYMDVDIIQVVEIPNNKYGLVSNATSFVEELFDAPKEEVFGKVAYYGYVFESNKVCPIDSDGAIQRLIQIEEGFYQDN